MIGLTVVKSKVLTRIADRMAETARALQALVDGTPKRRRRRKARKAKVAKAEAKPKPAKKVTKKDRGAALAQAAE